MSETVWRTPVPSTAFLRGADLEIRPRRQAVITFEFENEGDEISVGILEFSNVIHYRLTYLPALSTEMITECYDRVVDLGESTILTEVIGSLRDKEHLNEYRHFRILFDDGPCFDFIASNFYFS